MIYELTIDLQNYFVADQDGNFFPSNPSALRIMFADEESAVTAAKLVAEHFRLEMRTEDGSNHKDISDRLSLRPAVPNVHVSRVSCFHCGKPIIKGQPAALDKNAPAHKACIRKAKRRR